MMEEYNYEYNKAYRSLFQPNLYNQGSLLDYKQRTGLDSNCVEYWAAVTDRVIPNVIPDRYYVSTFGRTYNKNTNKPFGMSMHRKGYYQFNFSTNTPGKGITRKLHRVIMFTFAYFPGCEKYEINHIDGNKRNNCITNLEWCTSSENTIHAINMGLKTVFGNEYKVVLSDDDVKRILELRDSGCSIGDIYYLLGRPDVSLETISGICNGYARQAYFNHNKRYGESSSTSGNTYSLSN